MKKITMFAVALSMSISSFSQTVTVLAPATTGTTTQVRAPNGSVSHTTLRAHFIITAAELSAIPAGTTIQSLGFSMTTGATPTAAAGNIQIYMENTPDATNLKSTTWATAISTMTSTFNGAYAIPNVATPVNVDFALTTPFTYTGGGIYIAYDYLGSTFSTGFATYSATSILPSSCRTGETGVGITTPLAVLNQTSSFRPEMRFTFVNALVNDMSVEDLIVENGSINNLLQTSQSISGVVKNNGIVALTNVPVSLSITGASPFTNVLTIPTIAAGASLPVVWTAIPVSGLGSNTIQISVPADENLANNQQSLVQGVACDTLSFSNRGPALGGVGFNTGTGILAVRYNLASTTPVLVKGVGIEITNTPTNTGNTLKGVLCNAAGTIVDSTALFTLTAASLGQKINLNFINGNTNYANQEVYVGFRQTANAVTGYFPMGTQPGATPLNRFYGLNSNGGDTSSIDGLNVFMIDAILAGSLSLLGNAPGNTVCSGNTVNFIATPGYANYDFKLGGSSVQNTTSNLYTSPAINAATQFSVDVTKNLCSLSATRQINLSVINNTANASLCAGSTFTFGTQTLSAPGVYVDTFTSVAGCDSIVTLTLVGASPSSASITASICPGVPFVFGNQQILTAGTFTRTIPNAAGCDSVITLVSTLTPVDVSVTQAGALLTANATNATFQWVNCTNLQSIPGATSASYQPTAVTGQFSVIVTQNGCADSSACFTIDQTSVQDLELESKISLYPNPSAVEVNVKSEGVNIKGYSIIDINGRVIQSISFSQTETSLKLDVSKIAEGNYILNLDTDLGTIKKSFVKN